MKLYRAGEPTRGPAFWSPSPEEAKAHEPELAIHEAELLPGAKVHRFDPSVVKSRSLLEAHRADHDVLVFCAQDGTYEYVILNPHVLRILK